MDNAIKDAHDKGLITFDKVDWIAEVLKNPANYPKISIELARTRPLLRKLDFLDFFILYKESSN